MTQPASPLLDTGLGAALLGAAAAREQDMVRALVRLAEMESPSSDPAAQQAVLDAVQQALDDRGLRTLRTPGQGRSGGMLVAATATPVEPTTATPADATPTDATPTDDSGTPAPTPPAQ